MFQDSPYSVTLEATDIIVRVSRDAVDQAALSKLLDYLELETTRKRSQLTAAQADALADEIDRAVWDNLKPTFADE